MAEGEPARAGADQQGSGDFRAHLIRYGGDAYHEIVEKAQGCYVFDAKGRKILDFTSGQMCATVGHNHPNIVAAIKKSCDTALHLFSGMIPRSVVQLAEALAKIVPRPLAKSLFVNTGSESNEAAIKMAKLHTGGYEVVGLGGSWHGVTGNAGSVSFASDRKGYGPGMPGTFVIWAAALAPAAFAVVPSFAEVTGTFRMMAPGVEELREFGGLLIIAAATGVLSLRARQRGTRASRGA